MALKLSDLLSYRKDGRVAGSGMTKGEMPWRAFLPDSMCVDAIGWRALADIADVELGNVADVANVFVSHGYYLSFIII